MRLNSGLSAYQRRRARVVNVGDVALGGDHPIRVQSLTTPATTDTAATVAQIVRLVAAGCEIVGVTVRTTADADNLPELRAELRSRGVSVPLVADIHVFTPAAAMKAVEHVEKVRVNPGIFAGKRKFAPREFSDAEYDAELARLHEVLSPLVRRAKELGVAMRIGTNHGSLSDRIMNRFGDSPEGMVESALEFVRICEDWGYRDLVLSMKAPNPAVGLDVYRLLAQRTFALGMDYPLHLAVAEAGDGEDGRIKSAVGIGVLLEEGLGDTVRVSLSDEPVAQVQLALALVAPYNANLALSDGPPSGSWNSLRPRPSELVRPIQRTSRPVAIGPRTAGGHETVLVEVPLRSSLSQPDALRREIESEAGATVPAETRAGVVSVELQDAGEIDAVAALRTLMERFAPGVALSVQVAPLVGVGLDEALWTRLFASAHRVHAVIAGPLDTTATASLERGLRLSKTSRAALLVEAASRRGSAKDAVELAVETARRAASVDARALVTLDPALDLAPLFAYRKLAADLAAAALAIPIVLLDRPAQRGADDVLGPATAIGGLLCQGLGDAIHVESGAAPGDSRRLAFSILQAARVRVDP